MFTPAYYTKSRNWPRAFCWGMVLKGGLSSRLVYPDRERTEDPVEPQELLYYCLIAKWDWYDG